MFLDMKIVKICCQCKSIGVLLINQFTVLKQESIRLWTFRRVPLGPQAQLAFLQQFILKLSRIQNKWKDFIFFLKQKRVLDNYEFRAYKEHLLRKFLSFIAKCNSLLYTVRLVRYRKCRIPNKLDSVKKFFHCLLNARKYRVG